MTVTLSPIPASSESMPDGSWISVNQADTYMTTRSGAAGVWLTGSDKAAALVTAQRQLAACGKFDFSAVATPGTGEDWPQEMRDAVCEQALFVLIHQGDADRRQGLLAQGVVSAGVIQESWAGGPRVPISPYAEAMLAPYSATRTSFDWTR